MVERPDSRLEIIRECGWEFPAAVWDCLSDYEKAFAVNELTGQRTLAYYTERLRQIGFCGMGTVVDAACGMGQWSLALAAQNRRVEGVDINVGRLLVADALAAARGVDNCRFRFASIDALPFPDASVDAVFCYGAFMFTDMPRTLREFARVLRPGGRAYLNANSVGWYLHLLIDLGIKARDPVMVKTVMAALYRTLLRRRRNIIVTRAWLQGQLDAQGFDVHGLDSEGGIKLATAPASVLPAYPERYYGAPAILEAVAVRR